MSLIACGGLDPGRKKPVAVRGVLDLGAWDCEKEGFIMRKGMNEIVLQVTNDENQTGGIDRPLLLGDSKINFNPSVQNYLLARALLMCHNHCR